MSRCASIRTCRRPVPGLYKMFPRSESTATILPVKTHRSVLIVEDEEIIRTTLREFLTGEGYSVADAGTVDDALKLARQRDFDVAICDVQRPGGAGLARL